MLIRVGYDMAFRFPQPTAMVLMLSLHPSWHAFDPRHNVPRIGRVLMARGRDGADTALTTIFGVNQLEAFTVWTDEVSEEARRRPRSSPQDSVIYC